MHASELISCLTGVYITYSENDGDGGMCMKKIQKRRKRKGVNCIKKTD